MISASSPSVFNSLTDSLTSTLSPSSASSTPSEVTRAYIQLVGTLAKSSPQQMGGILKEVIEVILQSCKLQNEEEEDGREDDREVGLTVSGFEYFIFLI